MGDLGAGLTRDRDRARPAGAILAGGQSSRLGGGPKGLLEVGGKRMIDLAADALRPLVDELVIVSGAAGAQEWIPGTRVVLDVLDGGGSAAGIHAALVAMQRDVLVVAWDLPFVATSTLRLLVEKTGRREDGKTSDLASVVPAAVVPAHPNGMLEPLCAWYGPACIDAIARAWADGDRSAHGIVDRVNAVIVPSAEFTSLGGTEHLFFNVNTPADLEHARLACKRPGG